MSDFVYIDPREIQQITDGLRKLIPAVQDEVVPEVLEYMKNVEQAYPPYQHVSYKRAYGGWRSEKQRRFVMASIRTGRITIPYRRTQTLRRGWRIIGQGRNAYLINETPYAGYVKGDNTQARMLALGGWRTVSQDIKGRIGKMQAKMEAAAKRAIKKVNLG